MGLVPTISNRGSATFIEHDGIIGVSKALLRRCNKAIKTIMSLWVSDCDLLSPNIGVSLALNSFCNHLISALVVTKST